MREIPAPSRTLGHFRSLPPEIVFLALRRAIELVLEVGDALVDSYIAVARAAHLAGMTIRALDNKSGITHLLEPAAKAWGVECWSPTLRTGAYAKRKNGSEKTYHELVRSNIGLYEALRVLYGACQVVIGTVSARRDGELLDLVVGSVLDSSERFLLVDLRKSGWLGIREEAALPLPPIAVRCVKLLERLHRGLLQVKVLDASANLLAFPKKNGAPGLVRCLVTNTCESLDYFCDWAELPLDESAKRYYLRQHQLRRFFAMLFFWGHGFGGLDTLRDFLGHSNAKHVYAYITETLPGAVLSSVKAQFVAHQIIHSEVDAPLSALLKEAFGTSDFHLVATEDLEAYLSNLIVHGQLSVEPVFIDQGKSYKVLVKVMGDKGNPQ